MRYTSNVASAYRVKVVTVWNDESSDPGRTTATYYGPYSSKSVAKARATQAKKDGWFAWDVVAVKVEELTGEWEEVSD
jgi:hypothetical protein